MTLRPQALMYIDHFWPEISHRQMLAANIAGGLAESGWQVTVVAPQREPHWPAQFQYRNFDARRVFWPHRGAWRRRRFERCLSEELGVLAGGAHHVRPHFVVVGASSEMNALRRFADNRCDRLILVVGSELRAYAASNRAIPKALRANILAANSIVTYCATVGGWLRQQLNVENVLRCVPPPLAPPAPGATQVDRAAARRALGRLHPLLDVEEDQPVVLTCAEFDGDPGRDDLLVAWSDVVRALPRARLWMVGAGSDWHRVARRVGDMNLERSIAMPGVFDDWHDLTTAANCYVHPARWPGECLSLRQALAYGSAAVATCAWQTLEHHDSAPVARVAAGHPREMAARLIAMLRDPVGADRLGIDAAHWVEHHWPAEQVRTAWVESLTGRLALSVTAES